MYYMGFTYAEAYALPIWQRAWFIQRINQEFEKTNKNGEAASRAAHANTADQRALMGRHRAQVPAKLRRFT